MLINLMNKYIEEFKRYRLDQKIVSKPFNYIHVGLNPACQYSDLVGDILKAIQSAKKEAVEEYIKENEDCHYSGNSMGYGMGCLVGNRVIKS